MTTANNSSIDPQEIENFAKDSAYWWDQSGPFAPLHRMNPVRMGYIRSQIETHFARPSETARPFEGLKVLDIGCGGGLACESLSRLGGEVYGIDADENAIAVATDHAAQNGLDIAYRCGPAEKFLPREEGTYDVVTALEIIEHVADLDRFVKDCAALCKPGGLLIFSTLNRTVKARLMAVTAVEYILRWVPKGTHNWNKFVRPHELAAALRQAEAVPKDEKGIIFNPLSGEFKLSDKDMDVNYFMTAER